MAQVTIYLPDDVEHRARAAASSQKISLGRWVAQRVTEELKTAWPPAVLAALGSFPDFPEEKTLRKGYGQDSRREKLD